MYCVHGFNHSLNNYNVLWSYSINKSLQCIEKAGIIILARPRRSSGKVKRFFCFLLADTRPRRFYHSLSADASEKNVNKHTFNPCVYVYSVRQYTLLHRGHNRKESQKMVILPLTYTGKSEIIRLLAWDTYAVYDNTERDLKYDKLNNCKLH